MNHKSWWFGGAISRWVRPFSKGRCPYFDATIHHSGLMARNWDGDGDGRLAIQKKTAPGRRWRLGGILEVGEIFWFTSAIFRACRSVPRIMGFRVVFLCLMCVLIVFCVFFFFAWKHGSIRFLGLFKCWKQIHLSLDFTVRWNGWGVAEEMCQPHPTSLAWLLQPQRARILGARLLGGCESMGGILLLFWDTSFPELSICLWDTKRSHQRVKNPLRECHSEVFLTVFDGRTE